MTEYFSRPELPGRTFFRCQRLSATLQVQSCASRWHEANDERVAPENLTACRNCPVGARHAGVGEISLSPLRGMEICGRCHQGATRLVRRHLCVSCYNREREYLIGKNAKGSAPKLHPPLWRLRVSYWDGSGAQVLAMSGAVDISELVVAALRDCNRQVTFGFRAVKPALMQGDLFC